jgi:hypothetical protein
MCGKVIKAVPSWRLVVIAALAVLTSCTPDVEFPPPAQRPVPQGHERPVLRTQIHMDDSDADGFIGQDVEPAAPGTELRWTNAHPRFRLWPDETGGREINLRFQLLPETVSVTGPVTVSITVNSRKVAAPVFSAAQWYDYSHPVPDEMLAGSLPVLVGLDVSPVFTRKSEGSKLGIYLYSIGLSKARAR